MTPIIGISTNLHTVDKGKFLGMERIYVNKDYIDAVVKEGVQKGKIPPCRIGYLISVSNRDTNKSRVPNTFWTPSSSPGSRSGFHCPVCRSLRWFYSLGRRRYQPHLIRRLPSSLPGGISYRTRSGTMGVDRRNPKDRQASISHLPGNTIIECRIGRYALAGYHSHRPSGYATQPIQPTGGYFPPGKY